MSRPQIARAPASSSVRLGLFICVATQLFVTGCATKDAVFVTKTSFSVLDVDATPAGISVAHDRIEGYFGPRFDNGKVYPVTGYVYTNSSGPTRGVKQVFAGGEAATVVLGGDPNEDETAVTCNDPRKRKNPPLLFATGTTVGVKLGFAENTVVPTSFVFGYRRKEAAWVPVTATCQPSVLATLDSGATARVSAGGSKLNTGASQYFATGAAAVLLAGDDGIRETFKREARNALGEVAEFNNREAVHNHLTLDIFSCASRVPDASFDAVVTNAHELGVLPSGSAEHIRKGIDAKDQLGRYTRLLRLHNGEDDLRTEALTTHKTRVCELATTS
ncbi:MAG: hypothetical protein M3Q42_02000 [Pseudomonadota bacterium]|nr:hypothetical protein [Pseudomonadota bacterium]